MRRTLLREIREHVGRDVMIQGWVQTVRDQKTDDLRVEGPAEASLPMDPFGATEPGQDLRQDWRFLDLRRPENLLIFRVQTSAEMAMRQYWLEHGFVEIHSPKLMASASEFRRPGVQPGVLRTHRIPGAVAAVLLQQLGHVPSGGSQGDLDPQGERLLADWVRKTFDHEFVFVPDYPHQSRPFYHMRSDAAPFLTRSFDLLWNGVEVTTGAQREHRYEVLVRQAQEQGLRLEPIQFYLDVFRYGCPLHGGFDFGLARMLMVMLGQPNIREVTYQHRGPNRLSP